MKTLITSIALAALTVLCPLQAAQMPYTDPVNSTGNNFTILAPGNQIIGGTNDVAFTWDGTLNTSVAGAVSNATLTSDEAFFGNLWNAHDVTLYAPGTYTIYDGCAAGDPACGIGNAVTFSVGADQVGAHMLIDWPVGQPGASVSYFVTSITAPIASGRSTIAGWDSHPLENAAFARRTPKSDLRD